jgi:CzcA family heavy metal efflux pump
MTETDTGHTTKTRFSVAGWASRHVRSLLFMLVTLLAGGIIGTYALPVSLFPRVSFPLIRVNFDSGDRTAVQTETLVTRPVENALRNIPGIKTITSTTSRGGSEIRLMFNWGDNMVEAYLQTQAQIDRLLPILPPGTTFETRRMDPTVFPVIAYSLTSKTRPITELHDIAQYDLRPTLSTVPGVANIGVDGGAVQEYRVVIDPEKLAARNLALTDVTAALTAANTLSAVGHLEDHFKLYLVITDTQFKSIDEIGQTVLRSGPGGVTLLSDIATITPAEAPQYIHSTANGQDAVLINVFQQPGGNTVAIAAGIRDAFEAERKHLPADVTLTCWYDQSDLITNSATAVRDAVVIGVILAGLVLLVFLRDWRMTGIAILSVPIVLGITSLFLYLLNQSFNIMTLGGMAAAVGLIIDDAIVISEHIVRRLHETPQVEGANVPDTHTRVVNATDEFAKPLAGSSLSTIVIHIPPAFLVGVFGAFFAALSLSMATSLIISYFVAWLIIPVLATRLLKRSAGHVEYKGRVAHLSERWYVNIMRPILRAPALALIIVVPLLLLGYLSYSHVGSGVMPIIDEGGFVIDYIGPPGASIPEMDRLLNRVEKILQATPEVKAYSRRTGFSLGGDLSESNNGDFFVRLNPLPRRPIEQVMEEVRTKVEKTIPGLELEPAQLMEDLLGDLTGKPQPVVVKLSAEDESVLTGAANKIADQLSKVPGLSSIDSGVVPAGDALEIHVDRVKACQEGLDPDAISKNLNALLAGAVATQIQQGEKLVDVRIATPADVRKTTEDLQQLNLRAPDGHLVPLSRISTFELIPGQPEITREDLKRVVSVTARSSRDLGSTVRDVQALLEKPGVMPDGVRFTLGGQYAQQQEAFRGVVRVIAAAASLVFLLLLFLYERLRVAVAILIVSVLALATVFIGLALTRTELDISSMMGMVMIVGNVTEVAIFYYSEYAELDKNLPRNARLIAAGGLRMRAITMTTLAAILALLPLALDLGQGAAMLQPLAIAIITGLIVQLPLVLIVLPALLALFKLKAEESE